MHKRAPSNNLLLITFDQLRGDWFDPLFPVVPTPEITKIARNGWTFHRTYTSSPNCIPARMSWATGYHGSQIGVTLPLEIDLPPDSPSIVRDLKQQGWHTALVGKTHLTAHLPGRDLKNEKNRMHALGYDEIIEITGPRATMSVNSILTDVWDKAGLLTLVRNDLTERYGSNEISRSWQVKPTVLPSPLYPDVWVAEEAMKILETLPTEKPWFLWISFPGPHEPFDTPTEWVGRHQNHALPEPIPTPDWIHQLPDTAQLKKRHLQWNGLLPHQDITNFRKDYADHVVLLDEMVGKIMQTLHQRIDFDRTGIAITSDHGDLLGDMEMLYKNCFLEGAVRVPYIFHPPLRETTERGIHTNIPASSLDLIKKTFLRTSQNPEVNKKQMVQDLNIGKYPTGLSTIFSRFAFRSKKNNLLSLGDWVKSLENVVVEFGSEMLYVDESYKIVIDQNGAIQWAIHIANDPFEQYNLIGRDGKVKSPTKQLYNSVENAKREFELRNKTSWKKMNLLPLTNSSSL
ncbi:MAG: sulfatase-like hydrolase/transferase [Saprospiraceae bacterium]|jgi:arylsulfatase|nr:sulfatase-like hydrolase/transferase [Saprospiraceae bacterium]